MLETLEALSRKYHNNRETLLQLARASVWMDRYHTKDKKELPARGSEHYDRYFELFTNWCPMPSIGYQVFSLILSEGVTATKTKVELKLSGTTGKEFDAYLFCYKTLRTMESLIVNKVNV